MDRTPIAARRSPPLAASLARALGSGVSVIAAAVLLGSCADEPASLGLSDLAPDEQVYITRIVTLERAKAWALVDPEAGVSALDSLALSWGDSSQQATANLLSSEPERAAAIGRLLHNILIAEHDSLLFNPDGTRLHAPLPEPSPQTR